MSRAGSEVVTPPGFSVFLLMLFPRFLWQETRICQSHVRHAVCHAPDPQSGQLGERWTLTVRNRGLVRVSSALQDAGKAPQFDILKPWLIGDTESFSQADAAAALGTTAGAVKDDDPPPS